MTSCDSRIKSATGSTLKLFLKTGVFNDETSCRYQVNYSNFGDFGHDYGIDVVPNSGVNVASKVGAKVVHSSDGTYRMRSRMRPQ